MSVQYIKVKVSLKNNRTTEELARCFSSVLPGYYTVLTHCMQVQRNLVEACRGYQTGYHQATANNGEYYHFNRGVVASYDSKCVENGEVHEIAFLLHGVLVYATLATYALTFTTPAFENAEEKIKELFSPLPFCGGIQFRYSEEEGMEPVPCYVEMARRLESGELQTWDVPKMIPSVPEPPIPNPDEVKNSEQSLPSLRQETNGQITVSINKTDFIFVNCPRGQFTMGSPEVHKCPFPNGMMTEEYYLYSPGESRQMPRNQDETMHEVEISHGFWIQETPVTQKQWRALMEYNPSRTTESDFPVEQVNYFMVHTFLTRLNKRINKGGYEFRLPTEAQWEYASRAGEPNTRHYSDDINSIAWPDSQTHKVRQIPPNQWGIYDMLGNAAEWVEDWYADYPVKRETDPVGPPCGQFKVLRGGGFVTGHKQCRSANRHFAPPQMRYPLFGFRLALAIREREKDE